MNIEKNQYNDLFFEIKQIIDDSRTEIAVTVNTTITAAYWHIGKKIKSSLLEGKKAEYGKQIILNLAKRLTSEYGKGWSKQQLSWSHFKIIMYQDSDLKRDFYAQMCRLEKWITRTLQRKIDSMLFERTLISKKTDELVKSELQKLEEKNTLGNSTL